MVDLVDPTTVQDFLKLEKTFNATNYPQLQVIFDLMQGSFETELQRNLDVETYTEDFFVTFETKMIPLRALPVISITSVTHTVGSTTTTIEAADYFIMNYGIEIVPQVNRGKVTVVYSGGLEADEIPSAMQKAALLQIAHENNSKNHVGVEVINSESGSIVVPELQLLKEVRRLLAPHKHPYYGW